MLAQPMHRASDNGAARFFSIRFQMLPAFVWEGGGISSPHGVLLKANAACM